MLRGPCVPIAHTSGGQWGVCIVGHHSKYVRQHIWNEKLIEEKKKKELAKASHLAWRVEKIVLGAARTASLESLRAHISDTMLSIVTREWHRCCISFRTRSNRGQRNSTYSTSSTASSHSGQLREPSRMPEAWAQEPVPRVKLGEENVDFPMLAADPEINVWNQPPRLQSWCSLFPARQGN